MKNILKYAVIFLSPFAQATQQLQIPQYNVATNNGQLLQFGTKQVHGISPMLLQSNGMLQGNLAQNNNIYRNNISQGNLYGYNTNPIQNNLVNQQYSVSQVSNKLYNKNKDKSCQIAYAQSIGSYILDLSDTYDIAIYGNSIIQDFISKAKEKNYDVVYIDLCNTDVQPELVAQWNQLLQQNNIQVIWNLSNNSSINDLLFQYINSLDNIKGLNISNTNISSYGINALYQLLNNNTDSTIQFINIYGLNIPNASYLLSIAFQNHILLWKQKNNNQEYTVFKNAIIDNYNDNNNQLLSVNTNANMQNPNNNNIYQTMQQTVLQQQPYIKSQLSVQPLYSNNTSLYANNNIGNPQQYTLPILSNNYQQIPQQYNLQNQQLQQLQTNNSYIANMC